MENYSGQRDSALHKDATEAGMIRPIARWCECLHGQATLTDALKQIAGGIGAEIVLLSRVSRSKSGETRLLAADLRSDTGAIPVTRSFARSVLGPYFDNAKPGSTWFRSMAEDDPDPALTSFHNRRRLSDLVVIPLGVSAKHIDCLELHFAFRPQSVHQALLNTMADTFKSTWRNRTPGLATKSLFRTQTREALAEAGAPLLSVENPARLSRAEYRVCLLLSRGMSVSRVQDELDICNSTLRTHLRSIYSKTNARNLGELVYQLLSVAAHKPIPGSEERVA